MATYDDVQTAMLNCGASPRIKQFVQSVLPHGGSAKAVRLRSGLARRLAAYPAPKPRRSRNLALCMARHAWDEHGGIPRDDTVIGLDYIPPNMAKAAPYFDMGNAGLALVTVSRTTKYYRGRYPGYRSTCTESYLVGRNEAGTWFAHRVHSDCRSVRSALDWIWSGHAGQIVRRQGDIAVIAAPGPKGLGKLPSGHVVSADGRQITHATHPTIAAPGKGERAIVGRRAARKGNGAGFGTKD